MAHTKMTDKKPKAKAKAKAGPKKAKHAAAPGAGKTSTVTLETAVRQPGVERRRNHPMRAKDGYMQVILTQNVPYAGKTGDLVKVRPGFARNYLLPQGLAT